MPGFAAMVHGPNKGYSSLPKVYSSSAQWKAVLMEPSLKTMKRLFALCQNQCAFPDCLLPIAEENGTITGIICHIKAARPGGPRYDPAQTEVERHTFDNLMMLCARHSKVIDSEPERYAVRQLRSICSPYCLNIFQITYKTMHVMKFVV